MDRRDTQPATPEDSIMARLPPITNKDQALCLSPAAEVELGEDARGHAEAMHTRVFP